MPAPPGAANACKAVVAQALPPASRALTIFLRITRLSRDYYAKGLMRAILLFAACGLVCAQAPDPAYEPLARAYDALRGRDYDAAIAGFLKAIEAAPGLSRRDMFKAAEGNDPLQLTLEWKCSDATQDESDHEGRKHHA